MGSGAPPSLRTPLILLAIADLTALGMRLWPWPQVLTLPLNGATGIDPVVCLLTYIFLIFWIAGIRQPLIQRALGIGAMMGLLTGLLLAAEVALGAQPTGLYPAMVEHLQLGLLLLAGLLWGIAGALGARGEGAPTLGMLAGLWAAVTSALMACGAVLAEMFLSGPPADSTDPWKQYEGLAIGNPLTQALVHSLNSTTAFLLICPLIGGAVGLVFGSFGRSDKS